MQPCISIIKINLNANLDCCEELNHPLCINKCDDHHAALALEIGGSLGIFVLVSAITAVVVALCCYYHKKRKMNLTASIAQEGGLIVIGDDLKHANQEGHLYNYFIFRFKRGGFSFTCKKVSCPVMQCLSLGMILI